jgi:hypothetical protein
MLLTFDGEFDIELGVIAPTSIAPEGAILLTFRDKGSGIAVNLGIPKLQASSFARRITELSGHTGNGVPPAAEPVYGPDADEEVRKIAEALADAEPATNEG